MTKYVNAILAGAFTAGLLIAPAAVAQTRDPAMSTGGEQHNSEKKEMDSVREHQTTTPSAGASASEGRKSMDDNSTGSTSNSTPRGGKPLGPTDTQD